MKTIDISEDCGSLFGYVVSCSESNVGNYLDKHTEHADEIVRKLRSIGDGVKVALLCNMHVESDSRGNGVGSQLMNDFISQAFDAGASVFLLISDSQEIQDDGFDLKSWYESFGFVAVLEAGAGPLMAMPNSVAELLSN